MDKSKDSIDVAISTLLVSYLMKKFNLDNVYYGMVYGLVIQLVILLLNYDYKLVTVNWYYLLGLPIVSLLVLISYKLLNYLKNYQNKNYIIISLYEEENVKLFLRYVKDHKQYYDQIIDFNYGDLDAQFNLVHNRLNSLDIGFSEAAKTSQGFETPINFKDDYLNIEGFYMWHKSTRDFVIPDKAKKTISIKYIEIKIIKKPNLDIDIMNKITNFYTKNNTITLNYIKILKENDETQNHIASLYSG